MKKNYFILLGIWAISERKVVKLDSHLSESPLHRDATSVL
jgi:hypothetical protein